MTIRDPSDMNLVSMVYSVPTTGDFYSVNYTIGHLNLSDAGRYKCAVMLTFASTTLSINRTLDVTGNNIMTIPGSFHYQGPILFRIQLICRL